VSAIPRNYRKLEIGGRGSPSTAEAPPVSERHPAPAAARAPWLIMSGYLLGSLAVTWRLWADPAGRMPAGNREDIDVFTWFLHYTAVAVAHGRFPALITTALNAPRGVNLMWNTPFIAPGTLLTPVTLLAGPQTSLTVVLTLGFAGSAATMFWLLRDWRASLTAAALGGAVYGFSPALLESGIGHYNFHFAVLPPLLIGALLRIVTGRGHPARTGAWLGLLTAAQLFTGSELLFDTAVSGLVLVVALAASHPRAVPGRARDAALGLTTAAAVALFLCWPGLWAQFHGPLTEHYKMAGPWHADLRWFVVPPGNVLVHTPASAAWVSSQVLGIPEIMEYVGWPLLAVLVVAAVRFWRDHKVRAAAVTWAMLELISVGGGSPKGYSSWFPVWLLPYHWLQGLPVIGELLPNRFAIPADGAAAALLAFALDRARQAASQPGVQSWRRRSIPTLVAVLAILPIAPLPYQSAAVTPVPAGWRMAFARLQLAPDARVLVVPVPVVGDARAMRWQAETGEPGSLIGGYFLGPGPGGQPTFNPGPTGWAASFLRAPPRGQPRPAPAQLAQLRADLAYWRPAAVVAVASRLSWPGRVLTEILGQPTFRVDALLVWRLQAGGRS
jgi:hypothetical protein